MQSSHYKAKYFLCTLSTQVARKIVAHYNNELAPLGLTAQQLMALGALTFKEDISLGEFAKRLKIGKAAAATMITRLEALGLVTKERHPHDARLVVLKTTEKARALEPEIHKKMVDLENTIESQIGAAALKKIVFHLEKYLEADF